MTVLRPRAALAALAALSLAGMASAADVRIATEGAYAPWNYLDENGELAGYEIDLGNEVCARAGVECEWVINEWDSIIPNLQAGNYDVIMAGMSITDERMEMIDFTEAYFPPDPSRYVALAGSEFDFDALSGAKIGAQGATIQAGYAEENFSDGNTILTYELPDQSIADLAAGNLDLIIADGSYLEPIVEGSNGAIVFVGPDVNIGSGVGAGTRKDSADLNAAISQALASIKEDGTLEKLMVEYFGEASAFPE
jgi:polar amino acid transport system substrate-binding protein